MSKLKSLSLFISLFSFLKKTFDNVKIDKWKVKVVSALQWLASPFQLANKDWMQILVLYWIDLKESAATNNFCSLQWSFALSLGQVDYLLHFYISGFRAWLKQMVKQN